MTFRKAIHQAIKESDLTFWQKIYIRGRMLIHWNKIEDHIIGEAKLQGVIPNVLSLDSEANLDIDWDEIKKWIIEYLPMLLKLLAAILL